MSVTRINQFTAVAEHSDSLNTFLIELKGYIKTSEGCISCQLLRNSNEPEQFIVIEIWQSETHHQESVGNYPHEKMLEVMPLFAAPPKGGYFSES